MIQIFIIIFNHVRLNKQLGLHKKQFYYPKHNLK